MKIISFPEMGIPFLALNSLDALVTLAPKPIFVKWSGCMAILPKTWDAETASVQKGLPSSVKT